MHIIHRFIVAVLLCSSQMAFSQFTVGLIRYDTEAVYPGYNLVFPHNQPDVFLLNNCGEIMNKWEGQPDERPGNTAYLLTDGRLVKTHRPANVATDPIWAGGGGATIEIRDWDNQLLWKYTLNNDSLRLHHDIEVLEKEDGLTILAIAWEKKELETLIAVGRDTSILENDELWPDYIFEINPETNEIVWEWHAWDHLIQDRDTTLSNFGAISDFPGRIDINWDFDGTGNPDWMHSNAIDYDHATRQIILGVPNFNEVWIIDHTTTTEQASGRFGGLSRMGGDLMYRWGNNNAYKLGSATQKLFYQHDTQIIDDFIDPEDPNYGRIMVYNNRVSNQFSTVNLFTPTFLDYGWMYQFEDTGFAPSDFDQTIVHPEDSSRMRSNILSSAQYLPNGNFLICVGRFGYSFELTPENRIVWEYITPFRAGRAVSQGENLVMNDNLTFRMRRYPLAYEAFMDRDLMPKGTIETNTTASLCDQITSIDEESSDLLLVYPNPTNDYVYLSFNENPQPVQLSLLDLSGRMINKRLLFEWQGERLKVDVGSLPNGIYLIQVKMSEKTFGFRLIVQ